MLEKGSWLKWCAALIAYLAPYDHDWVILCAKDVDGALIGPTPPSNPAELATWRHLEKIAMAAISSTAFDLHAELIRKRECSKGLGSLEGPRGK